MKPHPTRFDDQGSTVNYHYSGAYTAEWIVEDPEEGSANAGGALYPFANFGSVTFSNMKSSFTSWSLTPDEEWAHRAKRCDAGGANEHHSRRLYRHLHRAVAES